MNKKILSYKYIIKGTVQGVGFRPFVYRTAAELGLSGTVENRTDGVIIIIQGKKEKISIFLQRLKQSPPPASRIQSVKTYHKYLPPFPGFRIIDSGITEGETTEISPDIAVCSNCLEDMKKQKHRINYPFVNCTNCGPRFTIIKSLPYDRERTSMSSFKMCSICRNEYTNTDDRRFHAQPVSCIRCGPFYTLHTEKNKTDKIDTVLENASDLINTGNIVLLKGIGGFNFICDALNINAVKKLREIKKRKTRPFAVMAENIEAVEKYVSADKTDKDIIKSWRRPVVIINDNGLLPAEINKGLSKTGIILPYMPFHYLLFRKLKTDCLVFTSGNISDEPIIKENREAIDKYLNQIGAVITYNRDICSRCDDSVVFTSEKYVRLIRRSRGWTPGSIRLNKSCDGILAAGGDLKNTFCLGKGDKAVLSQHIGDLKSYETEMFYRNSIDSFSKLFNVKIKKIARDLHPDYISGKFAESTGLPVLGIQHHHAHIASVLAEHGINRKVCGFAFDGNGYGTDGAVWGGEILISDLGGFERYSHLEYIPLPGGDSAVREPWRTGLSYLYTAFGDKFRDLNLPFLKKTGKREIETVTAMIKKKINSPLTSSMGRLFDAAAAVTDICMYSDYEAEAAMRLESYADKAVSDNSILRQYFKAVENSPGSLRYFFSKQYSDRNCKQEKIEYLADPYPFTAGKTTGCTDIIKGIVSDITSGHSASEISFKFHNTVSEIIVFYSEEIREKTGINTAALSGGVFNNKILLTLAERALEEKGFEVLSNKKVPSGDGGISLGQCAIAAEAVN